MIAQALVFTIACRRGLAPWPVEFAQHDPEEGGRHYAVRSWACGECLAWSDALASRGLLAKWQVSPIAAVAPASYERSGRHLCRRCFADFEALPATAAQLGGADDSAAVEFEASMDPSSVLTALVANAPAPAGIVPGRSWD